MDLNYKSFGSGEPLLILHGLLGSLDNWQTLAKKYAEYYTVFIIDLRNHGKSPHSEAFSYDLMVADILEFCEQNHIYNTNLLGHSMGGKVAMQFAVEHNDLVNKLIIADISPVNYPPGHDVIFEALLSVDLNKMESRSDVEEVLKQTIPEFGVRQFLMKGLTRADDNSFEWKFNLKSLWENYPKILNTFETTENFEGKTLFINGGSSKYVLTEYYTEIEKYFPNYNLETIENVGHWLHAENPKEFLEKTLNFLNK